MKLWSLVSAFAIATLGNAQLLEYAVLNKICEAGGDQSYVGVVYAGGYTTTFNYTQCYPYTIDGNIAIQAVFCKSASCFAKSNLDCTGTNFPPIVPVLLPAGSTLVNAANFVQLTGKGAVCDAPPLPIP